ncbi:BrnT family toxin [bacterium]|nr:BrnT family toxin [bacterium]
MGRAVYGDFEWDDAKARANLVKHGVSFPEALTVFSDPNAIDAPDRFVPSRFVIIGCSSRQRVLFVVHAERGERIRLISARKASAAQRRRYEEGIG